MADLGDFLRHVLDATGAPSQVHREEFLDAINTAYPPPQPPAPPEPEPGTPEAQQAAELAAAQARVAELEAQLDRPAGM